MTVGGITRLGNLITNLIFGCQNCVSCVGSAFDRFLVVLLTTGYQRVTETTENYSIYLLDGMSEPHNRKPRCKYCGCTEQPIVMRGHLECPKCHTVIESCCEGSFTLIELLAVVSIIAILVALQLPLLAKVKLEAQKTECLNYKRQLIQYYYMSDFEDGSPPYTIRPLMQVNRIGGKCYNCHASTP